MDKDKSISASNIPPFSQKWAREYWGSLLCLFLCLIAFINFDCQLILGYLSHQPDYNKILEDFSIWVVSVGSVADSLKNWVKKEHPQRYETLAWIAALTTTAGFSLIMFAEFRSAYPGLKIQWTFYPWKN